MQTLTGICL